MTNTPDTTSPGDAGASPAMAYARLLRDDFASFIAKSFHTNNPGTEYLPNWHIDLIAEYLEACRRGQITRLIINMPPRALKSLSVCVAWPAWLLGHNPSERIIAASYAANLAVKHSLDTREIIKSDWYRQLFPEVRLTRDQNEKHKFMTTKRGFRFATSVGGTLTGEGGNFLIIDDPLSPLQANSATAREHCNGWFEHTFASRLDNKEKGVIVLVMQRLHADDLSGHLLARGGWEHLCLPAVAEKEEIIDFGRVCILRDPGDALHPGRESAKLLMRARTELGSHAFSAQYQQAPVPPQGTMIRPWWLKRHTQAPATPERIVQSWDTAIKSAAHNDASACLTFAESEGVYYLLDVSAIRVEYPELKRAVLAEAKRWQPEAILIEDKASGQQLLQDLRREPGMPVIGTLPKGDKVTRFAAITAQIEAGKLSLPKEAAWLADFEKELLAFPGGKHDDQVDALTQFLDWARQRNLLKPTLRKL